MVSLRDVLGGTRGGDDPTAQLRIWEQILSGQGSVKHVLLVAMYSYLFWAVPPLWLCTAGRTLVTPGVADTLKGISGLAIMLSSGSTAFLLGLRRLKLLGLITKARLLSESVGHSSAALELKTATDMRLVRVLGFVYIKCGITMAALEQFADSPAIPRCIEPERGTWGRLAVACMESAKWGYLATCFFSFVLMLLTLLLAVEYQYAQLSERLHAACGHLSLMSCARHLRQILLLENNIRDFYFNALLYVLSGTLLVPLINTYEALTGEFSMFSMLTLSTMPLVYGSISVLGDRLLGGARKVGLSAYSGDWLVEPASDRRLRLMIMKTSTRVAPFAMRAHGGFTRAAAYHVVKTWYQYLNLLIGCLT